jgi:hypothetical protein
MSETAPLQPKSVATEKLREIKGPFLELARAVKEKQKSLHEYKERARLRAEARASVDSAIEQLHSHLLRHWDSGWARCAVDEADRIGRWFEKRKITPPQAPPGSAAPVSAAPAFRRAAEILLRITVNLPDFADEPLDGEARNRHLAERLRPHADPFVKSVRSQLRDAEPGPLSLEKAIRVNGVMKTRQLLAALAISEAVAPGSLEFHPETGAPRPAPSTLTGYSAGAVAAVGEDSRFAQTAFQCGLAFDLLALLSRQRSVVPDTEGLAPILSSSFEDAIRAALQCVKLSRERPDLRLHHLERHIAATPLLLGAGRALLALLEPGYRPLYRSMRARALPGFAWELVEQESFGVTHTRLAALIALVTPGTRPLWKALLLAEHPEGLKTGPDREAAAMARLVFEARENAD